MVTNRIPLRCIGGPKDGDVLLLPEGQGYVHVVDEKAVSRLIDYADSATIADVTQYQYRVEAITVGKRTFRVLVEQALTVADAVERLILCYQPRFT